MHLIGIFLHIAVGDVTYFHFMSAQGPPESATLSRSKDICSMYKVRDTGCFPFLISEIEIALRLNLICLSVLLSAKSLQPSYLLSKSDVFTKHILLL